MKRRNIKSRDNWNIPLCIRECQNKGKECEECIGFSNYKEYKIQLKRRK